MTATTVAAAPAPSQTGNSPPGSGGSVIKSPELMWVTVVGTAVSLGIGILWSFAPTRAFLIQWSWMLLVLAPAALMLFGRYVFEKLPMHARAAMMIFAAVPVLLCVFGGVSVLPQRFQLAALRVVFLVVVCLLPATLWYLFIATRKASLLNEFLANLNRLGLLCKLPGEDRVSKGRRVSSYLQKFGAIYGELPEKIYADVRANSYVEYSKSAVGGSTGLSTAVIPVMFATLLTGLGWFLTLPPGEVIGPIVAPSSGEVTVPPVTVAWIKAFNPTGAPVTLAFLGAYFYSLQMLFRRYVVKDLSGSAYVSVSMRIILAVIGVWVLSAVNAQTNFLTPNELLAAAFAIGVFPLIIWHVVASLLKRAGGAIAVPSMRSRLPISSLDGLTTWHETRLVEEDIESLPNMATADLVELLLNTRLPAERIVDWTDQAILYTQLGDDDEGKAARQKLRAHGIRTATSLLQARATAKRLQEQDSFAQILADNRGASIVPTLEAALRTNSNLNLILCWRGMCEDPRYTNGSHLPKPATTKPNNQTTGPSSCGQQNCC